MNTKDDISGFAALIFVISLAVYGVQYCLITHNEFR